MFFLQMFSKKSESEYTLEIVPTINYVSDVSIISVFHYAAYFQGLEKGVVLQIVLKNCTSSSCFIAIL